MQDRAGEPAHVAELLVGMQRVLVARQPVEQRLVFARLVRDRHVRRPLGGDVGCLGRATIAAPSTLAADEDGRGRLEQGLAVGNEGGDGLDRNDRALALVEDAGDLVDRLDLAGHRDLTVQDDALLTVDQHAGCHRNRGPTWRTCHPWR